MRNYRPIIVTIMTLAAFCRVESTYAQQQEPQPQQPTEQLMEQPVEPIQEPRQQPQQSQAAEELRQLQEQFRLLQEQMLQLQEQVAGQQVGQQAAQEQVQEQQAEHLQTEQEQLQQLADRQAEQAAQLEQLQSGQQELQGRDFGRISGSVETNNIWYVNDKVPAPADRFGSNSYLKLDYSIAGFTAGVQGEFYAPVLQGFNPNLQGARLTGKYAGWSDDHFSVTVGDFYEQFGAGLILRSYEDRALGFNNSLEGVRAGFSNSFIDIKGILARPRMFMGYADTWVRGADASISLSSLFKMQRHYLAIEGSFVNRYMGSYAGNEDITGVVRPDMDMYSGRFQFDTDFGFSIKGEYAGKGDDRYMVDGSWQARKGNAQLVEVGYSGHGLGIFMTARRLERMGIKIDANDGSEANTLNYLPALTRQYTYSLATLKPYATEVDNEIGGQVDVFYTFARGSKIGGKYGMKLHANFSTFYPLEKKGRKMNALYRDLSFDLEKQWTKGFKTTLMYAVQTFSPSLAVSATTHVNNIFVLDVLTKFTNKISMRVELQYLYSKENTDWWAAMAEFSFAPRWSFFVSDMYNHGSERVHYYSAGMALTLSRTRFAVSYGRNRAGYVCSGGVCRFMPEYTGANISLTTSF